MNPSRDIAPESASLEALAAETAKAWKRMALYPPDHPARAGALDRPLALLRSLLAAKGELSLGVARDGLVSAGRKITTPGAQDLAQALYLRDVAVVRIRGEVAREELDAFLGCLRLERGRAGDEQSFESQLAAAHVRSIVAEPVDYSSVVIGETGASTAPRRSLWDRILLAQLGEAPEEETGSLDRVLAWIESMRGAEGASVEGLATALADAVEEQLAEADDGDRNSTRQLARLLRALPPPLRDRFLEIALGRLAAPGPAPPGLEELAAAAPASELLAALRRMRDTGHAFSERALRLIHGLVAEAGPSAVTDGQAPPDDLQEALTDALTEDPSAAPGRPDDFVLHLPDRLVLAARPAAIGELLGTLTPVALTQSGLAVALTLLEGDGEEKEWLEGLLERLAAVFGELVLSGRALVAAALLQHLRQLTTRDDAEVSEAANRLLRRLAGPATAGTILQALRDATDTEASQLAYLTEVLGEPIGRHLLVQMCETEDRGERRRGFDFVQRLGSRIVPDALDLLRDTRWYVVRNMLQVLQTTGDPRMIARVRGLLRHGDHRVRLEAAKVLVRHDAAVTPELLEPLLTDENPTVQEGVMAAVGRDRVRAAVPPLLALATRRSAFGGSRTIRLRALRCLGEIGDPAALPGLRRYFSGLGATAEEKRAAFASLTGYPPAARSELVERGLTSNDPEIRALCRRLAEEVPDG